MCLEETDCEVETHVVVWMLGYFTSLYHSHTRLSTYAASVACILNFFCDLIKYGCFVEEEDAISPDQPGSEEGSLESLDFLTLFLPAMSIIST